VSTSRSRRGRGRMTRPNAHPIRVSTAGHGGGNRSAG